uniref:SAC domain-containing protein n=1 Tax=Polytomella parva TaxID=51329 RepID=A0A7S0URE1_9CHLO|mmetsp:Transcript_12032/g.21567  ORF Transcript_12032/g.21567 Transcript_12032/m.21567 type:complete len:667 (+) Transcript_12032:133-2133(+)
MSCYTLVRVYQQSTSVVLQPNETNKVLDTLSIDLTNGHINPKKASPSFGRPLEALAVLGICKLYEGVCIIVVTEAEVVATLNDASIYEVKGTKIIHSSDALKCKENRILISLLECALSMDEGGRGLYFSHFYDLTLSQQRAAAMQLNPELANKPVLARADPKFLWNRALAKPFMEAQAYRFITPLILGFVRQLTDLEFGTARRRAVGTLTLVARRGVDRAGVRQWRRGADSSGNVANFAETEQILSIGGSQASFVQIRGSIPLLWTQLPNIKYKPTTVIAPGGHSSVAFDKHCAQLLERYRAVVAVNLINHGGTEGKLESALRQEVIRFLNSFSGLRYVAFDFHHECRKGRYARVSLLWDKIRADFSVFGFFLAQDGAAVTQQLGAVRTNCIDCLDRTNVVQGVLARKNLEMILARLGLLQAGGSLPAAFPAIEQQFKILWADHGDALSFQYTGTGAMKSGFTRTGKRTVGGLIDDGLKSVTRYYLNNFQDGRKQDALDLFTGAFVMKKGRTLPLRSQPSPVLPVLLGVTSVAYGAFKTGAILQTFSQNAMAVVNSQIGDSVSSGIVDVKEKLGTGALLGSAMAAMKVAQSLVQWIVGGSALLAIQQAVSSMGGNSLLGSRAVQEAILPIFFGLSMLALVVKNGRHLVNRPQLCPELAITTAPPAK